MSSPAPDDDALQRANTEPMTTAVAQPAWACVVCGTAAFALFFASQLALLLPLILEQPDLTSSTAPLGLLALRVAAVPGVPAVILAWRARRRGVQPLLSNSRVARATLLGFALGTTGLLASGLIWLVTLVAALWPH